MTALYRSGRQAEALDAYQNARRALVDELGIDLDKDQQTSDWSTPVLTKAQLDYAAFDAQVLLPLYEKLCAAIAEAGLQRVARIENEALPAVARMRLEGMPVDKAAWVAHTAEVEAELKALERRMLEAAEPVGT
jgi:DNA polymerase-1